MGDVSSVSFFLVVFTSLASADPSTKAPGTPQRRAKADGLKLGLVVLCQPVGYVLIVARSGQSRQKHHSDRGGDIVHGVGDFKRACIAGKVKVRQHNDVAPAQRLDKCGILPLASVGRCRAQSKGSDPFGVLLTLGNKNGC